MFQVWKEKILSFQKRHESSLEGLFFVGGFVFDFLMVTEPDDLFGIIQQGLYLLAIAALIHFELLYRLHKWRPGPRLSKVWNFRNLLLHFLLGTLLNIYSIFYIKSASFLNSLVFLILMTGFVLANELPIVKKSKVSLKTGLFTICLFSYISILYPIILGFVGWTPFALSVLTTLLILYFQIKILSFRLPDQKTLAQALLFPSFSILVVFVAFYSMGWIPPVPLSVKEQGIYHFIEKKEGEYLLSTEKIWWKFWQSGDQEFYAQPGDKVYYYLQIYSPARFSDQIFIHWSFKDTQNHWQSSDRIPISIVGGRKEGYRGFTIKSNYQPGQWRVQVETAHGQEISRLYFEVIPQELGTPRHFEILAR